MTSFLRKPAQDWLIGKERTNSRLSYVQLKREKREREREKKKEEKVKSRSSSK